MVTSNAFSGAFFSAQALTERFETAGGTSDSGDSGQKLAIFASREGRSKWRALQCRTNDPVYEKKINKKEVLKIAPFPRINEGDS